MRRILILVRRGSQIHVYYISKRNPFRKHGKYFVQTVVPPLLSYVKIYFANRWSFER